jgi:type IV pilus assembly protein PilB
MLTDAKLQQIISETKVVPEADLAEALAFAQKEQRPLADILVERDLLSDEHLGQLMAEHAGYPFVNLRKVSIPDEVLRIIPETMARAMQVIAFGQTTTAIQLAMANPLDVATVHLIEKKIGKLAQVHFATQRDVRDALGYYKRGLQFEFAKLVEDQLGKQAGGTPPVVELLETMVQYAYMQKASDIHIEPTDDAVVIRFRVDGVLHDMVKLPKHILDTLITRIKILAKLRTDEHRSAQDGKMVQKLEQEDLDIRVSVLPVAEGEKAVLRLLSSRSRQYALEDIGFGDSDIQRVRKYLKRPQGMILVTGPTGSGKTTTLYAFLKILNRREVNISTIEDPVEYAIAGINQIQVNTATNLTFATGLRSIVRQDPDIIMIGEIRDEETAGIAVNSAMTGHLVLSTLHTNDAATTLPRLLDMAVEPYLAASTVNIAVGQRLVRKICTQCVMSEVVTGEQLKELATQFNLKQYLKKDAKQLRFYKGRGCNSCNHSGFVGRVGVFEVLELSPAIRQLIMNHADADQIKRQAIQEGMTTMFEDGFHKALLGVTTLEEVLRVVAE